jgi:hypothetical protein
MGCISAVSASRRRKPGTIRARIRSKPNHAGESRGSDAARSAILSFGLPAQGPNRFDARGDQRSASVDQRMRVGFLVGGFRTSGCVTGGKSSI